MCSAAIDRAVTVKFYGDESADETKSRVFAIAAVFGTEHDWAVSIREWLRRTRGKPFHANKCESEFAYHADRQKHKDNLKLYEDLTKLLAGNSLSGITVALDLQARAECLPAVEPDLGYYKCFSDVLHWVGITTRMFNDLPNEEIGSLVTGSDLVIG
jgi:hypothetical protein